MRDEEAEEESLEMRMSRRWRREASGSALLSSQTKLCIIQPQNRDNSSFRKENNMFTPLQSTETSVRGRPQTVNGSDRLGCDCPGVICKRHTQRHTPNNTL